MGKRDERAEEKEHGPSNLYGHYCSSECPESEAHTEEEYLLMKIQRGILLKKKYEK